MKCLAVFAIFLSSAAFANPCDCPRTDSMANDSCASMPAKANQKFLTRFHAECGTLNSDALKLTPAINALFTLNKTKTWKETMNYMSCYRPDDERFCHFKTTLAPLIELAAKSSKVPAAVQSCLVMKESMFKPVDNQDSGAMGYIQFMPGTDQDLQFLLKGSVKEWEKEIDTKYRTYDKKRKQLAKLKTKDKKSARLKSDVNYLRTRLLTMIARMQAKKAWDQYWEGTDSPPKKITMKSSKCPQVAMILSVAKQVYDLYLMKTLNKKMDVKSTDQGFSLNGMSERETAILMAGSYNDGIGNFADTCGAAKTYQKCLAQYSKEDQTRDYMEHVASCSKTGSLKPIHDKEPQKKCEESQCS